jgi:hypothetical protein
MWCEMWRTGKTLTVNDVSDGFQRKHGRRMQVGRPGDRRGLHLLHRHAMLLEQVEVLLREVQRIAA